MADPGALDEPILGTSLTPRKIEHFGRKVTTTANHLIGPLGDNASSTYQNAMTGINRELRRPGLQRRVFSFVQSSPTEVVRSTLSRSEIEHRALTYIPDELLKSIPEDENTFSLFQGFQASFPESNESEHRKRHRRQHDKDAKLLANGSISSRRSEGAPGLARLTKERDRTSHRLEMMGIRKNMCSAEILEIDKKIANLNQMRKIVLDRLSTLEADEVTVENELLDLDHQVEEMAESAELDSQKSASVRETPAESVVDENEDGTQTPTGTDADTFMSQSIYEKLPTPKTPRQRFQRRRTMPIRHGHFEPGTSVRVIPAHTDAVTAMDLDEPFGTMVTASLDDTVRVWDLNSGDCLGLLEGHRASVRCLQLEDKLVATGSIDASVRVWDLNQAALSSPPRDRARPRRATDTPQDALEAEDEESGPASSMYDSSSELCVIDTPVFTLQAHVAEVTALHFHHETLISGSADKTLRQWDLIKGRCVQTMDVLWAAAQASSSSLSAAASSSAPLNASATLPSTMSKSFLSSSTANLRKSMGSDTTWHTPFHATADTTADFVGALQVFDAALACGTADGLVRLWDLRSGQVSRSLIGHTGPVTSLQFDDTRLVTGSLDRSIRIWDLRTGAIADAYAHDHPVTAMMFDSRRIAAAAGAPVVKIYDMVEGRHWDCGEGLDDPTERARPRHRSELAGDEHGDGSGSEHGSDNRRRSGDESAIVERVRLRDGFLIEGRRDGRVGVWTC